MRILFEELVVQDLYFFVVSKRKKNTRIPWIPMLTSIPLWALVAAQIGHDWGFFTMVTDLPIYMNDVLKYKIGTTGFLSSVPYVVMWIVSMSSGWLCDWLVDRNYISISFARKMFTSIGKVYLFLPNFNCSSNINIIN